MEPRNSRALVATRSAKSRPDAGPMFSGSKTLLKALSAHAACDLTQRYSSPLSPVGFDVADRQNVPAAATEIVTLFSSDLIGGGDCPSRSIFGEPSSRKSFESSLTECAALASVLTNTR